MNYSDFGSQLATVSSDFTIVDAEWQNKHKELARLQFQTAIEQWKLVYKIWHSQIEHDALFSHLKDELTDPELISDAAGYLPDLANKGPPVSYRKVQRALMTTSAKDFSSALAEVNSAVK